MVKLSYYNNLGISDFSRIGLVWNLFANFGKQETSEIIQQSREGAVDRFDFTDKLIEKAAAGGIDLTQEEFNIGGFDYSHRQFRKLSDFKKLEKEVYLVNEIDKGGSEDVKDGYGEYSENRFVEEPEEHQLVEEGIDYSLAWGRFPEMSSKMETLGYSLVHLLLSTIQGRESAKKNLTILCEDDANFKEWVESIFLPGKLTDIERRLEEFRRLGAFV